MTMTLVVQPRPAPDDRGVVTETAGRRAARQIGEHRVDVIERIGAAGWRATWTRCIGAQVAVDLGAQLRQLLLERAQCLSQEAFKLLDLFFQLEQRFLKSNVYVAIRLLRVSRHPPQ